MNNQEKQFESANIWAPWRMEYLQNIEEIQKGCFICNYVENPQSDAENLVIARGKNIIALLNRFPYTGGHCLIAPYKHQATLQEIEPETLNEMMQLTRDLEAVLKDAFNPNGFNVGINVGRAAGAGLPDHLHMHIVPRWSGDTNFMPVFGKVAVVMEFLIKTRERILASAKKLGKTNFLPLEKSEK